MAEASGHEAAGGGHVLVEGMVPGDPTSQAPILVVPGLPRWFRAALLISLTAVLALGSFGLLLAYLGHYRLAVVLIAAILATGVLATLCWPGSAGVTVDSRAGSRAAVIMCVVAVLSGCWNAGYESNHVQVNRDPGAYAVAGKWIATQGSLQVPSSPAWDRSGVPVKLDSLATFTLADGGIQIQFDHFLPALLAEADGIGGDRLLFAVPALLAALGLLLIYAVGCYLGARPWLVVASVTALAVSLPQLNVARDTYSETSTQVLLWGAIWLALEWLRRPRLPTALVAGLLLGASVMTRIDALVYLIPVPLMLVALWRCGAAHPRRGASVSAFVLGLVPGVLLGSLDLMYRSNGYYRLLHSQVVALRWALALSVLAALGLAAWQRRPALVDRAAPASRSAWMRPRLSWAPVVVGVALLALWLLRPLVQRTRSSRFNDVVSGLQQAEGKPADGYRTYAEYSLHWMAWYLGPITVGLAILGVVVLVRQAGQLGAAASLVLGLLGGSSLLYLWAPSIVPDQIWASRRFVPATLPLLALAAALGIGASARWCALRWPGGAKYVPAILVLVVVGFPVATVAKVPALRTQDGFLAVISDTCRQIGPDAVVVFEPGGRLELTWPQTIRSWCGAPVAVLPPAASNAQVQALAAAWRTDGRTLWVLSDTAPAVQRLLGAGGAVIQLGSASSTHELKQTITRAPDAYTTERVRIFGGKVNRSDASGRSG